jgi:hypothetical protein
VAASVWRVRSITHSGKVYLMGSRLLLTTLLTLGACVARCQSPDDAKAKALSGIESLIRLRDDIGSRYAMFAIGERHRQLKGESNRVTGLWKIRSANRSQGFDYVANGHVITVRTTNHRRGTVFETDQQYWSEVVTCDGDTRTRSGSAMSAARSGYRTQPIRNNSNRLQETNKVSTGGFEPFDDLMLHPMFHDNPISNEKWIEQLFRSECEFLDANEGFGGDVGSRWHWQHGALDFEIEITHSKRHGYLPTKVQYTSKIDEFPNLHGLTRIEWARDRSSGRYLPLRLAAAYRQSILVKKLFLKFRWRVGDAAADKHFLCGRGDYRMPFEGSFDFEFDNYEVTGPNKGNYIPGSPWSPPSDLVIDGDGDLLVP